MRSCQLILGEPIFGVDQEYPLWSSFRLKELGRLVQDRYPDDQAVTARMMFEYCCLALTLHQVGIEFVIIYTDEAKSYLHEGTRDFLEGQYRIPWVKVPQLDPLHRLSRFPRDLCTYLPDVDTLLINKELCTLRLPDQIENMQLKRSALGEGGRVQVRKDLLVVSKQWVTKEGRLADIERELFGVIPSNRRIITMDPNVSCFQLPDDRVELNPDDHIDRYTALIEDRQGGLHLLVNLHEYCALENWRLRTSDKLRFLSPQRLLDDLGDRCKAKGVCLQVLQTIPQVPVALGVCQLADGRVIVTAKEAELTELLCDLVGSENVIVLPKSWEMSGCAARAGIHCYLNEVPRPFWEYLVSQAPG